MRRRRWGVAVQLVVVVSVLLAGVATADRQRAELAADLAAERGAGPAVALVQPAVTHAAPLVVEVPRLGIRSRLVDLHRTPAGTLEVPRDPQRAGWYVGSAHPGDAGPTVIAGHVDSYRGPGVFFRLRELHRGDRVVVRRSDGSAMRFVVESVLVVPKRSFPTALVYASHGRPALRLITCGGGFDRASGHYRDNVVVLARPS